MKSGFVRASRSGRGVRSGGAAATPAARDRHAASVLRAPAPRTEGSADSHDVATVYRTLVARRAWSELPDLLRECAARGQATVALKAVQAARKDDDGAACVGPDELVLVVRACGASQDEDAAQKLSAVASLVREGRGSKADRTLLQRTLIEACARAAARTDTTDTTVEVLRDMASSGGLHVVDATHVLTLFASHAPALVVPLFTKARELVTPDARMWLVAMKGSGDARKVLSLFDEFCAAHAAPSKHVLTLVLRAAVATRRFRVVEQVLALIAKFRVPVDLPLANALLGCATNARDGPALVKQVLDLMERGKVANDEATFNQRLLLHARLRQLDESLALFAEMQSRGISPSAATYTTLYTCARACGNADAAWGLFQSSLGHRVAPDNRVHAALLESVWYRTERPDLDARWRDAVSQWKEQHGPSESPTPFHVDAKVPKKRGPNPSPARQRFLRAKSTTTQRHQ